MMEIARTGYTEVYRPKDCAPVVDIILIHGLQGHPHRTWACAAPQDQYGTKAGDDDGRGRGLRHQFKNVARKLMRQKDSQKDARASSSASKSKDDMQTDAKDYQFAQVPGEHGKQMSSQGYKDKSTSKLENKEEVFWPADLLHEMCPKARISVYGYDTTVAGYSRVNKDHLYTLGKNFLYQLSLHRENNLPIIFIAHSLGGLVVKEALIMSIDSQDEDTHSIITSTFAVVFMGTPHRGSKEWASTGDKARKLAQAFFMSNNPSLLDSLGLKNGELFRSADRFTQLWHDLDFIVKTYQEGKPLIGIGLGHLGDKVVPDESSLLLNLKEQAESLTADHHEICKFSGTNDENWRKVGPRLRYYYGKVVARRDISQSATDDQQAVQDILASISLLDFEDAEYEIRLAHPGTFDWILDLPTFQSWLGNSRQTLLCINGKLGSGKSTLLRHVVRTLQEQNTKHRNIAAFFIGHTKEGSIRHTSADVFRSLLGQLTQSGSYAKDLLELTQIQKLVTQPCQNGRKQSQRLKEALLGLFRKFRSDQTLIFIDAIDDCNDKGELQNFFWETALVARTINIRIAFTSQGTLSAVDQHCTCINVEDLNSDDINLYIRDELNFGSAFSQHQNSILRSYIEQEACGVFVWVVMVVDLIQRHLDEGRDFQFLYEVLRAIPKQLGLLYRDLAKRFVESKSRDEIDVTIRVLQWVLFSARPLSFDEWHHVLAFIQNPFLQSIQEWKSSPTFTQPDELLTRRIKFLGCGFIDTKDRPRWKNPMAYTESVIDPPSFSSISKSTHSISNSLGAGAGSFEMHQYISVIHNSVRAYFTSGEGFSLLDPEIKHPEGEAHFYILETCMRYSFLEEMKQAFRLPSRRPRSRKRRWSLKHSPWLAQDTYVHRRSMSLGSSAGSSAYSSRPRSTAHEPESTKIKLRSRFSSTEELYGEKVIKMRSTLQWLDSLQPIESVSASATRGQIDVHSSQSTIDHVQVLNPPWLWQYSQDMLVHHATATDGASIDPRRVLDFLISQDWKDWAARRTDMDYSATLEHFAAQWNLVTWLRYFNDCSPEGMHTQGGYFDYPILAAIRLGRKEAFEYLLDQNPRLLELKDTYSRTGLHYASATKDPSFLELCTQNFHFRKSQSWSLREIVNDKDEAGQTALHIAAMHASAQGIKRLVSFGANLNEHDDSGNSPFHLAVSREVPDFTVCKTLLEAGCEWMPALENDLKGTMARLLQSLGY